MRVHCLNTNYKSTWRIEGPYITALMRMIAEPARMLDVVLVKALMAASSPRGLAAALGATLSGQGARIR